MREELERAWVDYRAIMRDPRYLRGRGKSEQDRASRALIDTARCQPDFDQIARRVIGLEGAEQAATPTMLLQGHVVVPYIYRHRFEHDVLEYALGQVHDELEVYRAELVDWLVYDGLGRPGEFHRWCAARGSTHRFARSGPPPLMRAYVYPPRARRGEPEPVSGRSDRP